MSNYIQEEKEFEPEVENYEVDCSTEIGKDVVMYLLEKITEKNNDAMVTVKCSDGSNYNAILSIYEWKYLVESKKAQGISISTVWITEKFNREKHELEEKRSKFLKRIKYPIMVKKIENKKIDYFKFKGSPLCVIRPCGKEYVNKSFIGIYLGELPISITTTYNQETKKLTNDTMPNPAIYVPELEKIIFGCESWWERIESMEDFKSITDENINNTWYMKLLEQLAPIGAKSKKEDM